MFHPTAYEPPYEHLPAGGGQPNHRKHIKDFPGVLDVVAVVSNPKRYRIRYDLYRAFERHMLESGVRLTTVELAFGSRPYEITQASNPRHVQLRTNYELWHKENLINLGVAHLPSDWRYLAWIDADITFVRPDWVQETLHALQHYAILQPWAHCVEVGPTFNPLKPYMGPDKIIASWGYCYCNHLPQKASFRVNFGDYGATGKSPGAPGWYYHPGFAWACRREAFEAMGGLQDWAILGGADYHMAAALVGCVERTLKYKLTDGYRQPFLEWQARTEKYIRRNLGYIDGTIIHHFHGRKTARRYVQRWDLLVKHQFDPVKDLRRDWQGLFSLNDSGSIRDIALRDDTRNYFAGRDEDSPLLD